MAQPGEKRQLFREMIEMGKCLRAAGVGFLIVLNTGGKNPRVAVDLNSSNSKQTLDMLASAMEAWKASKTSPTSGHKKSNK